MNLRRENSEAEAPKDQKSNRESKPSLSRYRKHGRLEPESLKTSELESLLKWRKAVEPNPKEAHRKSWQTHPEIEPEPEPVPVEVKPSAAERGQRDLFFLCHEILHYKDMLPRVHQQVCDLYGPPPDLTKPFEDQDTIHNYLLLDPRGEFKTSISIGKTIQNWINFPQAATLRMCGKEELAKNTVQEVKDHFLTNTDLRELYRDAVPWSDKKDEMDLAPSKWGTASSITHPHRKSPRREPTLSIGSLDSVKAGGHFEWITGDDLVHEKNYQTRELLQSTITDWDLARNLLNPRGYRELDGTRYDWSDLYGHTIEKNKGAWRIHVRPIWTDDLEFAKANGFLVPADYKPGDMLYLHPERWTLTELLEIQADNPYLFNCQRLNNPVPVANENFPMLGLVKHTITRDKYPDTGAMNLFLMLEFNFADPEAEPAVAVVGGWDCRGRLFIIDLVTGYMNPSKLIDTIVGLWQKWPISRVGFEDSKKQRMIEPGLLSRMRTLKLFFGIDWIKFGGNNQSDEDRISQVLALEPLLRENQLWFHSELPHLTNLYLQFSKFPKFKLRGIPYAVARLMHYRTQTQTISNSAVYGSELYSPALTWNKDDMELGAGLTG